MFVRQSPNIPNPSAVPTPTPLNNYYNPGILVHVWGEGGIAPKALLEAKPQPHFEIPDPVMSQGFIYYADGSDIVRYSIADNSDEVLYSEQSLEFEYTDFSIDENYLYVSQTIDQYGKKTNEGNRILVYDLSNGAIRYITNLPSSLYSIYRYIGKFGNEDIIASFGGDGCAGWGTIYRLLTNLDEIISIGAGCNTAPRYVGFWKEGRSLILAEGVTDDKGERLTKAYALSLDTGVTKTILEASDYDNTISRIFLVEDRQQLGVVTPTHFYLQNIATYTIEKSMKTNIPFVARSIQIERDRLFAIEKDGYDILELAGAGGRAYTSWTRVFNQYGHTPKYLGLYEGVPYYFILTNTH